MLLFGLAAAGALAAGVAAGVGTAGHAKTTAGYKVFVLPKFIGIPVFTPGSMMTGRKPKYRSVMSRNAAVLRGTTDYVPATHSTPAGLRTADLRR